MEKEQDIIYVRLSSGEEVVCKVNHYGPNELDISDPLEIKNILLEDGSEKTVFINYVPFSANNQCMLRLSQIVTYAPAHNEVKRYYYHSIPLVADYDDYTYQLLRETNASVLDKALEEDILEKVTSTPTSNTIH
jgi:hypothetical protein